MNRPVVRYALLMVTAAAAFSACSDRIMPADGSMDQMAPAPRAQPDRTSAFDSSAPKRLALSAAGTSEESQPRAPSAPLAQDVVASNLIVRSGSARVKVDSLASAMANVRALAAQLGGFVANVSVEAGQERVRMATLELKIPAARFDEAVRGLEPFGEVESVDITAQDVGEEYVDVSARVANARRLEERLLRLLEARTGKLEEVLAVERELARVREEIERMDGRLRYLRSRVAMSTLTVNLHEPAPLVSGPGQNIIVESFLQAWQNFVHFLAGLIAALGLIVPLAVILAGTVWLGRRGWRRLRHA
ncbi:MAG: DUF4349 domain-containing protein [Longimicrobiales bacterium]